MTLIEQARNALKNRKYNSANNLAQQILDSSSYSINEKIEAQIIIDAWRAKLQKIELKKNNKKNSKDIESLRRNSAIPYAAVRQTRGGNSARGSWSKWEDYKS